MYSQFNISARNIYGNTVETNIVEVLANEPTFSSALNVTQRIVYQDIATLEASITAGDHADLIGTSHTTDSFILDGDDGVGKWEMHVLYDESGTVVHTIYTKWDLVSTPLSASEIKTLYENNADTNAFTNAE